MKQPPISRHCRHRPASCRLLLHPSSLRPARQVFRREAVFSTETLDMPHFYDLTPCPDCHGSQRAEGSCLCGGSGLLPCASCCGKPDRPISSCPRCKGTGMETCVFCGGRGTPLCPTCHGAGHLPPELYAQIISQRRKNSSED